MRLIVRAVTITHKQEGINLMKMDKGFCEWVLKRTAQTSIGASTVHGNPEGTAAGAREFLGNVGLLTKFGQCGNESVFLDLLNKKTRNLQAKLPERPGGEKSSWGLARKCLNIFLREAFYNRYLFEYYKLEKLEPWLELPLDSHVARGIKSRANDSRLGKPTAFPGVGGVTPAINKEYQDLAEQLLENCPQCKPFKFIVHLDLLFWRHCGRPPTRHSL